MKMGLTSTFRKVLLVVLIAPWLAIAAWGKPKKINYKAKLLENTTINGSPCKSLVGEATFFFKEEGITIIADKAYKYDNKELIEATGHIRIKDKEGATITAGSLSYDGDHQHAKLSHSIICNIDKSVFYTENIVYNIKKKWGEFFGGGKLIQNNQTLTSTKGAYNQKDQTVTFQEKVVFTDPTYTLYCNTLVYNTTTEVAHFKGPTKIIHKEGTLTTPVGGTYNAKNKHLTFKKSKIEGDQFIFSADLLHLYDDKKSYIATGNVQLISKKEGVIITGNNGNYDKKGGKVEIYGSPLMKKPFQETTMYLSADKFIATETADNNNKNTTLLAQNNVKLYQADFQGIADSVSYNIKDAKVYLHNNPVIWCKEFQISSASINMLVGDRGITGMEVDSGAFIAFEDKGGNYNQIKGRKMAANFHEETLKNIKVEGNGECIYFVNNDNLELVGMNHVKCSHVAINMTDSALDRIIFYSKPIGIFYPTAKIEKSKRELEGFAWQGKDKPTEKGMLERDKYRKKG